MTVDLDELTILDSMGVGAIVSLWKRVKAQGGKVVVVHAHAQPLLVLKLLRLEAVFGMPALTRYVIRRAALPGFW